MASAVRQGRPEDIASVNGVLVKCSYSPEYLCKGGQSVEREREAGLCQLIAIGARGNTLICL